MDDSAFLIRTIGISGLVATGTSELLKQLKAVLDWPTRSGGDTMREIRKLHGKEHLSIAEFTAGLPTIDLEIDRCNRQFVLDNPNGCILEARLAVEAVKEIVTARSVLLVCEDEIRFRRVMERDSVSFEVARESTLSRDSDDIDRYNRLYGIPDFTDPKRYDHVINTGRLRPQECRNEVLRIMQNGI